MNTEIKTKAESFRLGLLALVVELEEIAEWADSVIESEEKVEDVFFSLTFSKSNGWAQALSDLSQVEGYIDSLVLERQVKDIFFKYGKRHRKKANEVSNRLFEIQSEESLPKRFRDDIYELNEVTGLFEDGLCFSYSDVEGRLLEVLRIEE